MSNLKVQGIEYSVADPFIQIRDIKYLNFNFKVSNSDFSGIKLGS
jgi:hypothetical protein